MSPAKNTLLNQMKKGSDVNKRVSQYQSNWPNGFVLTVLWPADLNLWWVA